VRGNRALRFLAKLNGLNVSAKLEDVPLLATKILASKTRGRGVVDL
jgi:hypothetical protein